MLPVTVRSDPSQFKFWDVVTFPLASDNQISPELEFTENEPHSTLPYSLEALRIRLVTSQLSPGYLTKEIHKTLCYCFRQKKTRDPRRLPNC